MSIAKPTIAIIGAGNMGSALMSGLIAKKHPPEKIWACGPSLEKLQPLKNRFGVLISTDNLKAVEQAEVVILAVKPQYFSVVAKELAPIVQKTKPLIISIMTGISLNSLEQGLGKKLDLVRCMPNTPVLVGCGASALYAAAHTSPEKRLLAETIWGSVGITVWLDDEKQMAAVTALSGSGPAYFFFNARSLARGGEKTRPFGRSLSALESANGLWCSTPRLGKCRRCR